MSVSLLRSDKASFKVVTRLTRFLFHLSFCLFIFGQHLSGQKIFWSAGMQNFFDNTEFAGSSNKIPQTMAGVRLLPALGVRIDSSLSIRAGADMLHEYGSRDFIDAVRPVAYLDYNSANLVFKMGAIPRKGILDDYPRIFFQDSVKFYRPEINGLYASFRKGWNNLDLWLDWTGRRGTDVREAFFAGFSGKYSFGNFYVKHNDYYFHYFITSNPADREALHDNSLFMTSAGADLSGLTFLDRLDMNAGWIAAAERARGENSGWIVRNGFISELRAEYKFAGIFNTLYIGNGLMNFYSDHSNELYWGDPGYRSSTVNRTDFYLTFFKKRKVDCQLTYSLHFMEGRVFNEQMLSIGIDIDGK